MIKLEFSQVSDKAALIDLDTHEMEPPDLGYLEFPIIEGAKGLIIAGLDSWIIAATVAECRDYVEWIGIIDTSFMTNNPINCIIVWSKSSSFERGQLIKLSDLGLNDLQSDLSS